LHSLHADELMRSANGWGIHDNDGSELFNLINRRCRTNKNNKERKRDRRPRKTTILTSEKPRHWVTQS